MFDPRQTLRETSRGEDQVHSSSEDDPWRLKALGHPLPRGERMAGEGRGPRERTTESWREIALICARPKGRGKPRDIVT